ncbi:hypothetical protein C6497_01250 [Candidatus Poribacteria bacterium]|nr:MAG: hypothetical protein C6497_01250 [Candidatus Poribacteria bacterium]
MPISGSGLDKFVRNSLSTTQGTSTLKIILFYSILGMLLNWILPDLILWYRPDFEPYDANYYGTIGSIGITVFLVVLSLIKGLILRNNTKRN